jgi:hypothetical protein
MFLFYGSQVRQFIQIPAVEHYSETVWYGLNFDDLFLQDPF